MTDRSLIEIFQELRQKRDLPSATYDKEDHIYKQGEPADTICYPAQGGVFLYKNTTKDGTIVSFHGEDGIFGLESTLEGNKSREYDAEAFMDGTEIVYVPYRDIKEDFAPELLQKTNQVRDERENRLRQRLELKRDVGLKGTICHELLNLSDKFGTEFDLKMDEMADLIATSGKSVIRYFSDLRDEGIVERKGLSRISLDREGLKRELERF